MTSLGPDSLGPNAFERGGTKQDVFRVTPATPGDDSQQQLRRRNAGQDGDQILLDGDGFEKEDDGGYFEHLKEGTQTLDGRLQSGKDAKARMGRTSPLMGTLKLDDLRDQLETGIEKKFAPLHIPPHRRLQTAAVALWAFFLPISIVLLLLLLSWPQCWYILIPYFFWIAFDRAPLHGGRPQEWARYSSLWTYFAREYIPTYDECIEADLPPDRPYLFGYHPHGIIGMGAFATFATEGTSFSEYFPGLKPHLLTLESNFKIPFYRELLLIHGCGSVSKKSCANVLSQGPGSAIAIVIGGAAESLSAHPGTADLTLKKRFGFVKLAIREGADLVPVFSFGENDVSVHVGANAKGSMVYKLQKRFQKAFGFTLPLFYGRGAEVLPTQLTKDVKPFRHPIVSVVGKPIHVERDPHPSDEKVRALQREYITELTRLWEKYKDLYARHRTKELTFVE
ncbi:hypothetical protein I350_03114 [Cryptococcus amylolentus CBS 6273]|uniref:Diacylglycerol O-acyltransferase n=1 Tax=Cryptococcus amylolentus CBS 6273 TaxID=1296118 RepID=A0A1E3K8X5_9TREE|nr:hypothetical protein I350_03114 [Cryptococcus amylolentus CBS 6273]